MQPTNTEIRRQLGSIPVNEYNMADMEFRIKHIEPAESKPSELDYDPDAWVALVKAY
jgi:hypothetical protein